MNLSIKAEPKKVYTMIILSILYACFILSFPKIDLVTSFLCIIMGCFYISIVLFVKDLFSPWGFLFIYQFLGYVDLTMVTIGISSGKGRYESIIYTISFFIMLVWSLAFSIGNNQVWRFSTYIKSIKKTKYNGNNVNIYIILIPCIIIYIYALYSAVITSYSLGGLYQGMLGGGKTFADQGYLMQLLALAGIIPVIYLYKGKRNKSIILMIMICVGILLTGRRSLAITTAVIPFLVYWNNKISKIDLKKVLLLSFPVIIIILLIGSIRTSQENGFSDMNTNSIILSNIALLGKYNGYGSNIPAMINELYNGNIDFQYFKYSLRGLEYLIPRSIWESKPLVHSSDIISNMIFFSGDVGRPVGPYGWAYFNFGMVGVFLSGLFTGQIAKRFYSWAIQQGSLLSLSCYGMLILSVLEIFQPEAQMRIILFSIIYYLMYILSEKIKIKI